MGAMEVIFAHNDIQDFILKLETSVIVRIDHMINRLGMYGNELKMPHSKALGNGLFELRILGKKQVRIIYTFHEGAAVLLHAFVKKSWTIPGKELRYAQKAIKEYIA
jgi:phage-related protein